MTDSERQILEEKIDTLIKLYAETYMGSEGIMTKDFQTGLISFNPQFLNHLPPDIKSSVELLLSKRNV